MVLIMEKLLNNLKRNKMKTYTIKWDEERLTMTRTNEDFSPLELIGLLKITLRSIEDQMNGLDTTPITTIKNIVEKE